MWICWHTIQNREVLGLGNPLNNVEAEVTYNVEEVKSREARNLNIRNVKSGPSPPLVFLLTVAFHTGS
jgi:hypothetical protein